VVDALTVLIAALVVLWIAGVAFAVWWLSSRVVPLVRDILETGGEEEKRKVIDALYPPRFRRD
jgi:flagellar basal body-associated protein FliL